MTNASPASQTPRKTVRYSGSERSFRGSRSWARRTASVCKANSSPTSPMTAITPSTPAATIQFGRRPGAIDAVTNSFCRAGGGVAVKVSGEGASAGPRYANASPQRGQGTRWPARRTAGDATKALQYGHDSGAAGIRVRPSQARGLLVYCWAADGGCPGGPPTARIPSPTVQSNNEGAPRRPLGPY